MVYKAAFKPILFFRSLFEIGGRVSYALAIAVMPITNASAILQATPLVVVLGAVIFLNEKVGWRRWGANIFGFFLRFFLFGPGGK